MAVGQSETIRDGLEMMMEIELLDTIKNLLSEVRSGCLEEEMYLVIGERLLWKLKGLAKSSSWQLIRSGESGGKRLAVRIFGMLVVCPPGYDGVTITPKSEMVHKQLSSLVVWG